MTDKPTIAIIGAGAVGGYYGARLAEHGHNLHFLLRSDYETWRTQGIQIQSIDGHFTLTPNQFHAHNNPHTMPKADLVIVTLKTTENRHLNGLVAPLLHDDTIVFTLQNGLGNEQTLADLFGPHRIVGGLAFTCINRIAPGKIDHSAFGHIRVGDFSTPSQSPRAEKIAAMFRAVKVRAETVPDLLLARWDKQVWNIPFNGLGALLDATTDKLIDTEEGTALVRAIMNEVLQAAAADGAVLSLTTPDQKIAATRSMGPYFTSTQIDRRLRKPMEIDAIFTRALTAARAKSQHLPLLEMLNFSLQQLDNNRSDNLLPAAT